MPDRNLRKLALSQGEFQRARAAANAANAAGDVRPALHFDESGGAQAVAYAYDAVLPRGGNLLEIGATWKTLLPSHFDFAQLTGIGVSAGELSRNALLSGFVTQDVGVAPLLPFDDAVFDGVFCTNFVAYLCEPVALFAEVRRVIKPGAPLVTAWGRRFFPDRVTLAWRGADDARRFTLVREFFVQSEADGAVWKNVRTETRNENNGLFSPPVFAASAVAGPFPLSAGEQRAASRDGNGSTFVSAEATRLLKPA